MKNWPKKEEENGPWSPKEAIGYKINGPKALFLIQIKDPICTGSSKPNEWDKASHPDLKFWLKQMPIEPK